MRFSNFQMFYLRIQAIPDSLQRIVGYKYRNCRSHVCGISEQKKIAGGVCIYHSEQLIIIYHSEQLIIIN